MSTSSNVQSATSKLPIDKIIAEYLELQSKVANISDTNEMIKVSKKLSLDAKKYNLSCFIRKNLDNVLDAKKTIGECSDNSEDVEIKELLVEEIKENEEKIEIAGEELLQFLTPVDERDEKNVLFEIKAGAGGDESALFAAELVKTYQIMADTLGLKFSITGMSVNDLGGYKDVTIEIKGLNAYSWFKYEGGVHRVQRVPSTEKQGRVHTSTVAVIVSPLLEEDDNEFKLDMSEVEIIVTTSQGAGGQSVNTTYSAIKTKHLPTGIEAQCQDERNQQQNKIKALQVLTSRVYDHFQDIKRAQESKDRQDQVGTMDRSEKIRTYNFPQDRLTDHRFSQNWNQLPTIMNGGIYKIVQDIKKLEAQKFLETL
jgi:peptide chain release factor 1